MRWIIFLNIFEYFGDLAYTTSWRYPEIEASTSNDMKEPLQELANSRTSEAITSHPFPTPRYTLKETLLGTKAFRIDFATTHGPKRPIASDD